MVATGRCGSLVNYFDYFVEAFFERWRVYVQPVLHEFQGRFRDFPNARGISFEGGSKRNFDIVADDLLRAVLAAKGYTTNPVSAFAMRGIEDNAVAPQALRHPLKHEFIDERFARMVGGVTGEFFADVVAVDVDEAFFFGEGFQQGSLAAAGYTYADICFHTLSIGVVR